MRQTFDASYLCVALNETFPLLIVGLCCLMGNKLGLSASLETVQSSSSSSDSASLPGTNVRRKRSAKEAVSECEVEDISPRKKAKKTSDYIYETLFCQGQDSDIIIKALGKTYIHTGAQFKTEDVDLSFTHHCQFCKSHYV